MKKTYEAPEAKFIGFAPMENLANSASWNWASQFESEDGMESTGSQVDVVYPNNPEGNYRRR